MREGDNVDGCPICVRVKVEVVVMMVIVYYMYKLQYSRVWWLRLYQLFCVKRERNELDLLS